jgi:ribose transport system permease protein
MMKETAVVPDEDVAADPPQEGRRAQSEIESQSRLPSTSSRGRVSVGRLMARGGLLIALALAIAAFGAVRPDTFLTLDNLNSILLQSAAPLILAVGLTVLLVIRDFDLSIGSMLGLGGATAVSLMSLHGVPWVLAIALALAVAVAVGFLNGFITAYLGASSFITTLAMGTILVGVEFIFTAQKTIYDGLAPGYLTLGQSAPFWGINVQTWFAVAIAALTWVLLEHTELGRYLYAIGGNPEAAYFSGIPVRQLRVFGFIAVAVGAAVAGILVTAQAGSSSPQAGISYLLPAYAAAFLGSTAFRSTDFNVAGTVVAVFFLQVIQTGLQMLSFSTAYINIVQGVVLILAMLLSRLERATA